jgi:exosortase
MSTQEKEVIKARESEEAPGEKPSGDDLIEIPLIGVQFPRSWLPLLFAGFGAVVVFGWSFLQHLPATWFEEEGYYSHGILIPFMSLAVIYMRREQIAKEPVGSSPLGLVLLLLGCLLLLLGKRIDNNLSVAAAGFILALIGGAYFSFGRYVARHLLGPLLFLVFMMPVLGWFIDNFTNPLQVISTRIAEKMLNIAGFQTAISPVYPTRIDMNNYTLIVGGPCSGFKLILALTAFAVFFLMISKMNWWRSLVFIALILPLALFINGLRIMLIGVVGENGSHPLFSWLRNYGDDPGLVFHDYSGYITLIVCFLILNVIVKYLEGGASRAQET